MVTKTKALIESRVGTGFTLVELLVVISLISALFLVGISSYTQVSKRNRDERTRTDLGIIQQALQQYFLNQGFYPADNGNDPLNLTTTTSLTNCTGQPVSPCTPTYTYLNEIPKGSSVAGYCYKSLPSQNSTLTCDNNTTKCSYYQLYARFETMTGTLSCGGNNDYSFVVQPT